jgi:hypothetical protein
MDDFDRDPLDLLDDDGDGVNEMCLFFDEDDKDKHGGNKPAGNSGCCGVLLIIGSSVSVGWWCVSNFFT